MGIHRLCYVMLWIPILKASLMTVALPWKSSEKNCGVPQYQDLEVNNDEGDNYL